MSVAALPAGYRELAHLARGDALDVFEVFSEERGCSCVLKTLRPDRHDHPRAGARLLAEGRLLGRLAHPHLVRAYETHEQPVPAVVLETLDGETLEHLLSRRRRPLSLAEVGALAEQLCSAVGYLHRHGVLHLDVKPANIVAEAGRVKLIDLSVARAPGVVPRGFGTPGYMAPEQVSGGAVSTATDVWGVATVIREALGRRRRLPTVLREALDAATADDPADRLTLAQLRSAG